MEAAYFSFEKTTTFTIYPVRDKTWVARIDNEISKSHRDVIMVEKPPYPPPESHQIDTKEITYIYLLTSNFPVMTRLSLFKARKYIPEGSDVTSRF
jgi:hypothetical protein